MHTQPEKAMDAGASSDGTKGARKKWGSFKEAFTQSSDLPEEEEDWWSNNRWKARVNVVMAEKGLNVIIPPKEKERPWLLFDHYIAVQPWKEDFEPEEEKITRIAAWIRISQLSLDYYDTGILHVLGSQVGKVLKVDKATMKRKKGCFAHICVELGLNSPLRPIVLNNGKAKRVQYEGIHLICFRCGRYGHDTDHCSSTKEGSIDKGSHKGRGTMEGAGMGNMEKTYRGHSTEGENGVVGDGVAGSDTVALYDSWMIVQRPRWVRRPGTTTGKSGEERRESRVENRFVWRGSQFSALNINDEEKGVDTLTKNIGTDTGGVNANTQEYASCVGKVRGEYTSETRVSHLPGPQNKKGEVGSSQLKSRGESNKDEGKKGSANENMGHLLKIKSGMDHTLEGSIGPNQTTLEMEGNSELLGRTEEEARASVGITLLHAETANLQNNCGAQSSARPVVSNVVDNPIDPGSTLIWNFLV